MGMADDLANCLKTIWARQVGGDRYKQAVLGEGFGQVFVGTDHMRPRAVEQTVLRGTA